MAVLVPDMLQNSGRLEKKNGKTSLFPPESQVTLGYPPWGEPHPSPTTGMDFPSPVVFSWGKALPGGSSWFSWGVWGLQKGVGAL